MAEANLPNDLDGLDIDNWECLYAGGMHTMYQYYPVDQWETKHVRHWLLDVSARNNMGSPDLGDLQNCTGIQFLSMSAQDFQFRCPQYGRVFHDEFSSYIQSPSYPGNNEYQPEMLPGPATTNSALAPGVSSPYYQGVHGDASHYNSANTASYIPEEQWSSSPSPYGDYYSHHSHFGPYYTDTQESSNPSFGPQSPLENKPLDCYSQGDLRLPDIQSGISTLYRGYTPAEPHHPNIASPDPRTTHPEGTGSPETSKQTPDRRRRTRGQRGPKLWEFLLNLLNDPTYNPRIIRWENQEEHSFKLIEPQEVSQLWGQRKTIENLLPYDYFARALRYHYKNQFLMSVPERKLVYKFGPKVFQQRR